MSECHVHSDILFFAGFRANLLFKGKVISLLYNRFIINIICNLLLCRGLMPSRTLARNMTSEEHSKKNNFFV